MRLPTWVVVPVRLVAAAVRHPNSAQVMTIRGGRGCRAGGAHGAGSESLVSTFTTSELADYAAEHGAGIPLLISSHGETYGIGGFSWVPDEGIIYLSGACPHDPLNPAAISVPDDPVATARVRHDLAEKRAAHLEALAAEIRANYPEPGLPHVLTRRAAR